MDGTLDTWLSLPEVAAALACELTDAEAGIDSVERLARGVAKTEQAFDWTKEDAA